MTIKEIQILPIYKQMCAREKWRNFHTNNGHRKQSIGSLDLISNKGAGHIYIVENTALPGWFKVGMTDNEKTFLNRMRSYKSIIPIGEWNRVYFEYTIDSAKEELKIKQFFKFECEYEMGVNSKEWFKGDWSVMNNIVTLKNAIEYKQQRVCSQKYVK
jgi:hypothetical protein